MTNPESDPFNEGEVYSLNMDIDAVRALHDHLQYAIQMWPGAPRRPAEEQVFLHDLKSALFTIMLEYNFHNNSTDRT